MKVSYIYILHFLKPLHHARHYTGYAESPFRLYEHLTGKYTSREPKILKAAREAGVEFVIACSFPGTRQDERRIKNVGHAEYYCPICKLERQIKRLQNKVQENDLFIDELRAMIEAKQSQHLSLIDERRTHAEFVKKKGERKLRKVA